MPGAVHQRQFYLKTMGCQMNEHDSEVIVGILESLGYLSCETPEQADLIMYNTCCVRENPERKVYGHLGAFRLLKEKNPNLLIAICGCMTQQKAELSQITRRLPHVDLVFGTHNIHRLPELLDRALGGERVVEIWEESGAIQEDLPVRRASSLKGFVNIIYGCTNFCSYCIVPYTRGKERSREPRHIIDEVTSLATSGYREVTLLGQNVNAYGKDLHNVTSFADLLTMLNDIPLLERIRFTTNHPRDMDARLLVALASLDKVCEHLHLPVQSGSTRVLASMNRGYTREYYLELVTRIKEAVPEINITTDLIVGFPGESEADFRDTLSLVEKVQFGSAFTFLYSRRQGTPAAKMQDQVPDEVKKARIYELIEVQNRISLQKMEDMVGREVEVLIETYDAKNACLVGRTRTNRSIRFAGTPDEVGRIALVTVNKAQTFRLSGER